MTPILRTAKKFCKPIIWHHLLRWQTGAIGFADASIRHDYVNGCDSSPVVFLEGIFVLPSFRQRGLAKQLIAAVQRWGTNKGCREMASDTTPENTISQKVHQALGFEETERVIFYRKRC